MLAKRTSITYLRPSLCYFRSFIWNLFFFFFFNIPSFWPSTFLRWKKKKKEKKSISNLWPGLAIIYLAFPFTWPLAHSLELYSSDYIYPSISNIGLPLSLTTPSRAISPPGRVYFLSSLCLVAVATGLLLLLLLSLLPPLPLHNSDQLNLNFTSFFTNFIIFLLPHIAPPSAAHQEPAPLCQINLVVVGNHRNPTSIDRPRARVLAARS